VALSAVSGGMFEIGDDLPTLGKSPDRLAWLKNTDLLDMVKLGRAAKPVDLLTYAKEDLEPSIYALKESSRQSIVAVFNWSESTQNHDLPLAELGLNPNHKYKSVEFLVPNAASTDVVGTLHVSQPLHSVRLLKLIDTDVADQQPVAKITAAENGATGADVAFEAAPASSNNPVLQYRWNFGDGTTVDGQSVTHAFTRTGNYTVTLTTTGLDHASASAQTSVTITGSISTRFHGETQRRLSPDVE
jgi:alpha-galactosidase